MKIRYEGLSVHFAIHKNTSAVGFGQSDSEALVVIKATLPIMAPLPGLFGLAALGERVSAQAHTQGPHLPDCACASHSKPPRAQAARGNGP